MRLSLVTIALVCAAATSANTADDRVGQAWIDINRSVMISCAQARIAGSGSRDAQIDRATKDATQTAEQQLLPLIGGPSIATDKATQAALILFIENNCIVKPTVDQGNSVVKVTLEVPVSRAGSGPAPAQTDPQPTPAQAGPFTSLIVDTLGLKVERAMSPKIRRADGSEVWGTVKADYDFVEDHGVVVYARSVEDAGKNARAGTNPLIVKAIDRAGGEFHCDAVISDADAKLVLDENAKTKFLDGYKVIFVVDGAR